MKRLLTVFAALFWLPVFLLTSMLQNALAAEISEAPIPEFFGVYAKMKDGRLIELHSVVPYQYKAFERTNGGSGILGGDPMNTDFGRALGAMSAPANRYLNGKPDLELRVSEVAGFYVYGDYDLASFAITGFQPAKITSDTILIADSDTGPGIRNPNNFIDSERGWALESSFRYVEKKPKLFWIVPRENVDLGKTDASFLAIRFDNNRYWPFSFGQEEYATLLDESKAFFQQKKYIKSGDAAQKSLDIHPTPEAYTLLAASHCMQFHLEDALKVAQEGLKRWPDIVGLRILAGDIHTSLDEFEDAIPYFKPLVDKGVPASGHYNGLAWCYVMLDQNLDEAITLAKKGLRFTENDDQKVHSYTTIAQAYIQKQDYRSAKTYCKKALELEPESFFALQHKAKIEFFQEEEALKKTNRRKNIDHPSFSVESLQPAVVGTWVGTCTTAENKNPIHIRLLVKETPVPNEFLAEYHFKRDEDPRWGMFKMKGHFNLTTGRMLLSGYEKVADPGWTYRMADIYVAVADDPLTVTWSLPGSKEFEMHRE